MISACHVASVHVMFLLFGGICNVPCLSLCACVFVSVIHLCRHYLDLIFISTASSSTSNRPIMLTAGFNIYSPAMFIVASLLCNRDAVIFAK